MKAYDVVIVGTGHAGAQAAIALRQLQFAGSILLIGAEHDIPYERPPLTKEYLSGAKTFERILLRPPSFWSDRSVALKLGTTVIAVDAPKRELETHAGERIGYTHLIWAAGGAPRRLSCAGAALHGVHHVRTRADADAMLAELGAAQRAVVIGGGYIGLEAAAVLAKAGKQVVLLEAMDRVLARVSGEAVSRFYEREHRGNGVDIRLGVAVACLEGERGVSGVRLADGSLVAADMVIVGIGIEPTVAPLLAAGAAGGNGVLVDAQCRTSLPDIYAVGDCALHANRFADGATIRIESVQNANDQASVAARTIVGEDARYDAVPWFWSNQYDLKLQTVGLAIGHDEAVLRGDPAMRRFTVVYLKATRVVALDCINSVKDYVQGRKLVEAGTRTTADAIADVAVPLTSLLPA